MDELPRDIEVWFRERPKWVQDAARRIVQYSELDTDDIEELIALCRIEAGLDDPLCRMLVPHVIPEGSLFVENDRLNLRLDVVSDVKGVNALAPKNPLDFGKAPICIIYGQNGSGKSGYVRLLKHACGARKPGLLLQNVFESIKPEQQCIFKFTTQGATKEIRWDSNQGFCNELKSVEIYDSDCAQVYVNDENEVAYEPWILSLFSRLTEVCDRVSEGIKEEIAHNVSLKPLFPEALIKTESALWYEKINYKTTAIEINSKCQWTEADGQELDMIKQRLAETNPATKAQILKKTKSNVELLRQDIQGCIDKLSDINCKEYLLAKEDALQKRKAANEDAKKVFDGAALQGVGTESWKLLWEQARAYSEQVAYKQEKFPNTSENALCVLCQQPLKELGRSRFESFEKYVKGNLEKQALSAEKRVTQLLSNIEKTSLGDGLAIRLDAAGLVDELEREKVTSCFTMLQNRLNDLLSEDFQNLSPLPDKSIIDYLNNLISMIQNQVEKYEEDAKINNRPTLNAKSEELEAKKWLFQQKQSIENEVARLIKIQKLKMAQGLTNTQSLSSKKSTLADQLITAEFINKFNEEMKMLSASRVQVEMLKTRAQKGHIYHQVKLKNCANSVRTADVLSEGELRIISLAAFLANVGCGDCNTPFIFDDPISSLDQDYEEATVDRLVALSQSRQVIVFTHRISMLTLLEETAKKAEVMTNIICLRREAWGTGEPSSVPIFARKPDKALNFVLNDRLPKARKLIQENGQDHYDIVAKGICSDFRIILERLIETEMLADVVHRFRRSVNTLGKIHKLALIKDEDCQLFDSLLTKYSRYEHSQSIESPVLMPTPEELKADMEKVMMWITDFKGRI